MNPVQLKLCYLQRTSVEQSLTGDLRPALGTAWGAAAGVLLGQAFDGLIWGRLRDGQLALATDELPHVGARLRAETLLNLRLFDRERELRVWRTETGLRACQVCEAATGQQPYAGYQEQSYELLRQPKKTELPATASFVLLQGLAGQHHAPPGESESFVPQRLRVRHYLELDPETGLLRLAEHRLLALEP